MEADPFGVAAIGNMQIQALRVRLFYTMEISPEGKNHWKHQLV
jgi:hypothetical protein